MAGATRTPGGKSRLQRVVRDDEELVIDGGRIRLQFTRHASRTTRVRLLLDSDVKVVQQSADDVSDSRLSQPVTVPV